MQLPKKEKYINWGSEELAPCSVLSIFISDLGDLASSKSHQAYDEGQQKPLRTEKDYAVLKTLKVTLNNCDLMPSKEFRK